MSFCRTRVTATFYYVLAPWERNSLREILAVVARTTGAEVVVVNSYRKIPADVRRGHVVRPGQGLARRSNGSIVVFAEDLTTPQGVSAACRLFRSS